MRTDVSLRHLPRTPQWRAAVKCLEEKTDRLLGRFGRGVRSAEVVVRGGGDRTAGASLRCTVKVALARGKAVVVNSTGATPAAAAADALLRARRTVARRLDALAPRTGRATLRRATP